MSTPIAGSPPSSTDVDHEYRPPSLPLEVGRMIVEIAAAEDSHTATVLERVARRVQAWVDPILYRNVALTEGNMNRFLYTIQAKTKVFLASHIKVLSIWYLPLHSGDKSVHRVLDVCTGLEDLGLFWQSRDPTQYSPYLHELVDSILPTILAHPPRGLVISFTSLLRIGADLRISILCPLPARITHLYSLGMHDHQGVNIFDVFPELTHLALHLPDPLFDFLNKLQSGGLEIQEDMVPTLEMKIPTAPYVAATLQRVVKDSLPNRLVVLIAHTNVQRVETRGEAVLKAVTSQFSDPRIVVMLQQGIGDHWRDQTSGKRDVWREAEEIVRQRRISNANTSAV